MNSQVLITTIIFLSLTFRFGTADDVAGKKEAKEAASGKKGGPIDSKFIAGSKWKGTVRELKGQEELTTDVLVAIKKREGSQFQGTYEVGNGEFLYAIEGTIERNQVNFKFVKIEKLPKSANNPVNLVGVQNRGTLRMDAKTREPTITSFYKWESAKDSSVVKRGEVSLALVEEEKKTEATPKE